MTHDDVIRLAREVADPDTVDPLCGGDQRDLITLNLDEMVRFTALVAAAEREACARLVEEIPYPQPRVAGHQLRGHDYLAAAIRARGETCSFS